MMITTDSFNPTMRFAFPFRGPFLFFVHLCRYFCIAENGIIHLSSKQENQKIQKKMNQYPRTGSVLRCIFGKEEQVCHFIPACFQYRGIRPEDDRMLETAKGIHHQSGKADGVPL